MGIGEVTSDLGLAGERGGARCRSGGCGRGADLEPPFPGRTAPARVAGTPAARPPQLRLTQ